MRISGVLLVCFASNAIAQPAPKAQPKPDGYIAPLGTSDTLKGEKAQALLRAFRLAGLKPTTRKSTWTWTTKNVACQATATPDGLGDVACQVDGKRLAGAQAYVLNNAMLAADLVEGDFASPPHAAARRLTCVDDQAASASDVYLCTYSTGP